MMLTNHSTTISATKTAVLREFGIMGKRINTLRNMFYFSSFFLATAAVRAAPVPLPPSDGRKLTVH